jgi:Holliday junction resolvasome RuvABC endonuclease subunit
MADIIIGIDPGFEGAIAAIRRTGEYVCVCNTPVIAGQAKAKKEYNMQAIIASIEELRNRHYIGLVVIEEPMAMPRQSCVATARQFTGYGMWLGLMAEYKMVTAPPAKWKRALSLNAEKSNCIHAASTLFPQWKLNECATKHELSLRSGCAEALLLAEYGRRIYASS